MVERGRWRTPIFVTAMMSLFIVLWLMNSSEKIKKAVAGYFNDPKGTANLLGTTVAGNGVATTATSDANMQKLQDLKQKLEQEIKERKDLEKLSKQIEITITPEGLRIELLEDKNGTFYQSGSARLSPSGQELLALLGAELKTLPNQLLIEGHTDAAQYSSDANYSNWELSADRANAARRLLQQDGVRSDQVTQVRGYADQFLRVKDNPYDPSNRRITILVKNQDGVAPPHLSHAQVVDGGRGAGAADPPKSGPAASASTPAAAPGAAGAGNSSPPSNGPVKPSPKAGLMGRLTGLFSGKKK